MSRMKPMSSMRSASSSTRISTPERSSVRWPTWSSRRPGWRRGCPRFFQRADLRVDVDAAEHDQRGQRQMLAVGLHRPSTWAASSRVGSGSGSAGGRAGAGGCGSRPACSSGSVKPAVLPVPVCAAASRSPPASTWGWPGPGWAWAWSNPPRRWHAGMGSPARGWRRFAWGFIRWSGASPPHASMRHQSGLREGSAPRGERIVENAAGDWCRSEAGTISVPRNGEPFSGPGGQIPPSASGASAQSGEE